MKDKEELKLVWKASGYANAEMIKMYLESFGIHVYIFGESVGSAYGLVNTPLGEVDIFVPVSQSENARSQLEIFNEDHSDDHDPD